MCCLHFAAQSGKEELVVALLDNGSDPSLTDKRGRRPHDIAKQREYVAIAEKLRLNCKAIGKSSGGGSSQRSTALELPPAGLSLPPAGLSLPPAGLSLPPAGSLLPSAGSALQRMPVSGSAYRQPPTSAEQPPTKKRRTSSAGQAAVPYTTSADAGSSADSKD